jgi:hypothetical protein
VALYSFHSRGVNHGVSSIDSGSKSMADATILYGRVPFLQRRVLRKDESTFIVALLCRLK